MSTSGTYAFDPTIADIVLDAFERIQVYPSAITPDHMFSARRSLNLIFSRYANRQVNLWTVDEQTVILNEGQSLYDVPANTVSMLETWVRNYQLGANQSVAVALSTTISTTEVEVTLADHGLVVGRWVSIPIYVSVGGLVVQGSYLVTSVTGANTFTVAAASAASSTVSGGGAVPQYATTLDSTTITVTLNDHGFVGGDTYTVHVATTVGGLALSGDYIVQTVPTANTLTITAASAASSTDSAFENAGLMQVATQDTTVTPQDRILNPISRADWAALPNKTQQGGFPTTYWFNRTDPPTVNVWQVPDGTMVMELHYFRVRQLQDGAPTNGQTPDIPYRFEEALCADLAYLLAIKWKPEAAEALKAYAAEVWAEAATEDRERVTLNMVPQMGIYYR